MALDKLAIGVRIRNIREINYNRETRASFADRCGLTESHVGQIERGDILISLAALDKIINATGADSRYILYGIEDRKIPSIRRKINSFLDICDKEQLHMIFQCISAIKGYIFKAM